MIWNPFGWIIQKISREEKKYGYSTICELIGDMFNFSWRVRSSLGRNESTIVTDKQTIGQGFYTDAALLLLLLPASSCTFNMLYMALVINTKSNIMAVSRLHAVSVQHVCVCVCVFVGNWRGKYRDTLTDKRECHFPGAGSSSNCLTSFLSVDFFFASSREICCGRVTNLTQSQSLSGFACWLLAMRICLFLFQYGYWPFSSRNNASGRLLCVCL